MNPEQDGRRQKTLHDCVVRTRSFVLSAITNMNNKSRAAVSYPGDGVAAADSCRSEGHPRGCLARDCHSSRMEMTPRTDRSELRRWVTRQDEGAGSGWRAVRDQVGIRGATGGHRSVTAAGRPAGRERTPPVTAGASGAETPQPAPAGPGRPIRNRRTPSTHRPRRAPATRRPARAATVPAARRP